MNLIINQMMQFQVMHESNVSTPVFDGANEHDIMDALEMANDYANSDWETF